MAHTSHMEWESQTLTAVFLNCFVAIPVQKITTNASTEVAFPDFI